MLSKKSLAAFLWAWDGFIGYPRATICIVCQKKGPQVSGGICILLYIREINGLKNARHVFEGRWRDSGITLSVVIVEGRVMRFGSVLPL